MQHAMGRNSNADEAYASKDSLNRIELANKIELCGV